MLAKLELVSFHAAVFVAASVLLYFLILLSGMERAFGTTQMFSGWLLCSGICVAAISWLSRAYSVTRWKEAAPHGASIVVFVAHLAPAAAGYILYLFSSHGAGSGVVFLPLIAWALFFYPIGIIWSLIRLAQ
jgi:hypothetical protein